MTTSSSTGPRTPEGKATSSRNAIKHGLTAQQTVIAGENQADFDALLEGIAADRKPEGELEVQAVGEIAACTWRLARARAKEAELLGTDEDLMVAGTAPGFDRLLRYMSAIERQFNRSIVRLRELQTERAKRQIVKEADKKPLAMAAGAANSTTCAEPEFVSSDPKPATPPPSVNAPIPAVRPEVQ